MVRAKFHVTQKISHLTSVDDGTGKYAAKEVGTVTLSPVYGKGNEEWARYTPAGEIKMTVDNPGAYDSFKLGAHYFVDFTRVSE